MHWKREGAYTGEISPLMLDEIGVDIVELGHSERRQYYNENNIDINKKAKTALDFNFTPLICVGENYEAKKYGISEEMIRKQLKIIFNNIKREEAKKLLIAYEPVWAIGEKGEPAKPEYAEKIHILIRSYLEEKYDNMTSKNIPLIYGGSVNNENALKFLTRTNIDGLFIGRAAWDVESFLNIIHKINFFKYNS
ncbi:triosephosphate isomerase [Sporohalobacter salinus]|nr:triosephosphate isomerase [Sporohalobacter salinus]